MDVNKPDIDQALDIMTIRILALIAQTSSVSKTAERLGYSQPAISQRLHRAEDRLGIQLVRRQGNSVALTEAGMVLVSVSPRIEEALEDARLGLADLTTMKTGSFTLSGFPSASATLIPMIISSLRAARPGVQLSYVEAEPPDAWQLMRERKIDAAVICTYPGEPERSGASVKRIPLFTDPLYAIMPASHPLAGERTVEIADLESAEWIAGCPLCRSYVTTACHQSGFTPRITLETDNFAAVVGFVSRGLGVSIVPALILRTVALPASVAVRSLAQPADRTLQLIADQSVSQTPILRAAIRMFAALDAGAWGLRTLLRPGPS